VNLRLAEDPAAIAALPIDHFDGLDTFDDLPRDGRCVSHMWF
ncbi:MAG TPA: GFA family protein, partial [Hyphomicrobiaceae bacterium]